MNYLARILGTTKVLWPFYVGIVISSIGTAIASLVSPFLIRDATDTIVDAIGAKLDVNTLERDGEASELSLNEVGTVSLRLAQPLVVDAYADHRTTGSFILIDPASGATVGAGLISGTHGVEYSI